jgi:hypothetical protein
MYNNKNGIGSANHGRTMVIEDHSRKDELHLLNDYILHRVEPSLYNKKEADFKPVL